MAGRPNLGKKRIQVKLDPVVVVAIDSMRADFKPKLDRSAFIQTACLDFMSRRRKSRRR